MLYDTREEWLLAAVDAQREEFKGNALPLPRKLYVSVGFPALRGAIGECWGGSHIFISPALKAPQVLATLRHELIHAALPPDVKHGRPFSRAARRMGLTAPWTATAWPDRAEITRLLRLLGPYPHAVLQSEGGSRPKQSTRMIRMVCPECGRISRTARSGIAAYGPDICPCASVVMHIEG